MKTITTIITSYNHREYIAQAIESAISQKGDFRHEILLADDASSDGTREIVRGYAAKHPDLVKDVSVDENLGISGNMKRTFDLASGDYIAILEGDDYWTDDRKLAKQLDFLERNGDCSMVFSRIRLRTGDEYSLLPRHDGLPEKLDHPELVAVDSMNPICNFSCCLFRSRPVKMIPDVAYEHRLSEVTVAFFLVQFGRIGYIGECLSVYRIHERGTYAGADEVHRMRQALDTFLTVRKVAQSTCWDLLSDYIENIKRGLVDAELRSGRRLISIVTITYNNLDGLKKTAESVAAQTHADFEWIVVDGGSDDGTQDYMAKAPRRPDVFVSEPDGGVYDAQNKGIARARGVYVICMNAGDTFRSDDVLERVVEAGLSADVVYGDWVRYCGDHEELCQSPAEMPPFFFFMPGCNICHQAMFVRTDLLQQSKFDTKYYVCADWVKWRHLMAEGCSFKHVPIVVCTFDAIDGLSSVRTWRNILDSIRFQSDFPEGVTSQAMTLKRMRDCAANGEAQLVNRIRELERANKRLKFSPVCFPGWVLLKIWGGCVCLCQNGVAYTWNRFCEKLARKKRCLRRRLKRS